MRVEQFGAFSASGAASDNNTTLTAAIGAASTAGGGVVELPAGTYAITQVTLPAGVILAGAGEDVTTLTSTVADEVITMNDRSGLRDLTLDGLSAAAGGIGLHAVDLDNSKIERTRVKTFDVGVHVKGGAFNDWRRFSIEACNTGAKLHGDLDTGDTALGSTWEHNAWRGGEIRSCIATGVELSYEDTPCQYQRFEAVDFTGNVADALKLNGAQQTVLQGCRFTGNSINLAVADDSLTDNNPANQVIGLRAQDCLMDGGAETYTGLCQDIVWDRSTFLGVTTTLTLPVNTILRNDCIVDATSTLSGTAFKLGTARSVDNHVTIKGSTTGTSYATAYSTLIEPGELVYCEVIAIARQNGGVYNSVLKLRGSVDRPGSKLVYDQQTANFTAGAILTGATSEATALIQKDTDGGDNGTLTLAEIEGAFQDNEALSDDQGGAAIADGILTEQDATIHLTSSVVAVTEDYSATDARIVATAGNLEVEVTSGSALLYEWTVHVSVWGT